MTRLSSPASERNRGPILEVLREWLPPRGAMLEIACGSGQHALHFAAALPGWQWLPTDPSAEALASARAWRAQAGTPNLLEARALDVLDEPWPLPEASFDAAFCANMLHISPWETCGALMRGSARCLKPGAVLALYGPYVVDGMPTAASNVAFDADLRARDPRWGLRRLQAVADEAAAAGWSLAAERAMPANNLMLRLERAR